MKSAQVKMRTNSSSVDDNEESQAGGALFRIRVREEAISWEGGAPCISRGNESISERENSCALHLW